MNEASLAIILKDGQLLLTQRKDVPVWVFPGGGIERGEKPEEACLREVYEETGLKARIQRKALFLKPVNRLASETHVFLCEIESGEPQLSNETRQIAYFPLDKLPPHFFWPHQRWLKEALASTSCRERELKEINYCNLLLYFLKHPWIFCRFLKTFVARSAESKSL